MTKANTDLLKAFAGSSIVLIITIALHFFSEQLVFVHSKILPLSLFYFLLNGGVFMFLYQKKNFQDGEGVLTYIIIMTVRIVLSLVLLVLFLHFNRTDFDKLFALNFFVIYLLYGWFEINPFIPNLRAIS